MLWDSILSQSTDLNLVLAIVLTVFIAAGLIGLLEVLFLPMARVADICSGLHCDDFIPWQYGWLNFLLDFLHVLCQCASGTLFASLNLKLELEIGRIDWGAAQEKSLIQVTEYIPNVTQQPNKIFLSQLVWMSKSDNSSTHENVFSYTARLLILKSIPQSPTIQSEGFDFASQSRIQKEKSSMSLSSGW